MTNPEFMLNEFITSFDAKPDWNVLIVEESKEVLEAITHLLKELTDLEYVVAGGIVTKTLNENILGTSPEFLAAAKWYDLLGRAFDPIRDEALKRVHASNMSKLDDNGKPIRRDDGKIMKGPNYKPPVLVDLVANV